MNQEQNNLNPNNFSLQENNGMADNELLQNSQNLNAFNQSVEQNTNVIQSANNSQPQQTSNLRQETNQINGVQTFPQETNVIGNINPSNQTFNQSVEQNTNVIQSTINSQPQQTSNLQQETNQINDVQTFPQETNVIGNVNPSNQTFNSVPPKRINLGLIIGISVAVIAVIIGVVFMISREKDGSNSGIFGSGVNSISSEQISKYQLETDTIWINKALGITYNIPKKISGSMLNGSSGFSYIHGSSFQYDNGYSIYVDKSLENHTNLETLASDIIGEKISDKYKFVYEFGSKLKTKFNNAFEEKVKIGDFDTLYFESTELDASSVFGEGLKIKILGYSFKYNDQYISVYGEVLVEEDSKLEELKQMLQYIINSIKQYNGESLKQLGGNAKNYYDSGYTSSNCWAYQFDDNGKCTSNTCLEDCNKDYFIVNFLSSHSLNGVLHNHGSALDVMVKIDPQRLNWDGTLEDIFKSTQNPKFYYNEYGKMDFPYYSDFRWVLWNYDKEDGKWKNHKKTEILKEEKMQIENVDMIKYLIKTSYSKGNGGEYIVVYTFIVDNVPYVMSYHLSSTVYDKLNDIQNMTLEQSDVVIKQTEMVADSFMITFRFLNLEPYDKYTNYQVSY